MKRKELVEKVMSDADLSKAAAERVVDSVFEAIAVSLEAQEEVNLVGFGKFSIAERAATTGRNPRTGESLDIPAKRQVKFTVGKGLKDRVGFPEKPAKK